VLPEFERSSLILRSPGYAPCPSDKVRRKMGIMDHWWKDNEGETSSIGGDTCPCGTVSVSF
jgi:hypothetical protein